MCAVQDLIWRGSYGSTTIDLICEKAGVKKGSFYYFFQSKVDLAIASIEESSKEKRVQLDSIFSPTVPPLDRLKNYCQFVYDSQCEMKKTCGSILGCPLFTLGSEISTQEKKLGDKIREMLDNYTKYLESAIRDAQAGGWIERGDAPAKARILLAYYEGVMTQARIRNDAELMREMADGTLAVLGVREQSQAAA